MKTIFSFLFLLFAVIGCTNLKNYSSSNYDDPIYGINQKSTSTENKEEIFSCKNFSQSFDKFTGVTAISSPVVEIGELSIRNRATINMMILKKITEQDTIFQIEFLGTTGTYNAFAEGVIILLENGEKIDVPNASFKLVQADNIADIYLGNINLTKEMIDLLKNNRITDLRVFAYTSLAANDFVVPENKGLELKFYTNCLLTPE